MSSQYLTDTEELTAEEWQDIEALTAESNRADGTHYGAPEEADRYLLLYEESSQDTGREACGETDADRLLAVLALFRMGETCGGRPVTELAAFTAPAERRRGHFRYLMEELEEVLEEEDLAGTVLRFAVYETPHTAAVLERLGAARDHDELILRMTLPAAEQGAAEEADKTAELLPLTWTEPGPEDADGTDGPPARHYDTGDSECYVRVSGEEAYLYGVLTDPAKRNRHCARKLLAGVLEGLRAEGVRSIFLEVSDANLPAMRLYTHLGFAVEDRLSYYYCLAGLHRDPADML